MKSLKKYPLLLLLFCVVAESSFSTSCTWNGTVSTSWATALNWTPSGVPSSGDDVIVPAGTPRSCVITGVGAKNCKNLLIHAGGVLVYNSTSGSQLNVFGSLTVNGILSHSSESYIYMKGVGQTLGGTGIFVATRIYFDNGSTTTLVNDVTVDEIYIYNSPATSLSISSYTFTVSKTLTQLGVLNLNTGLCIDKALVLGLTASRLNHNTGTFMWDISDHSTSAVWNFYDDDFYSLRFTCATGNSIYLENFDIPNLTLRGDLIIDPGTTLVCNDALAMYSANTNPVPIVIGEHWQNNGTFINATGVVTFNGGDAQIIGDTSPTTFYDLVINNTSIGVTLNQPTTVSHALTLASGIVYSTNDTLVLADNATSTPGNATSYVVGPIKKIGDDPFIFPVGEGTKWARIGITAPSAITDAFTAQYAATSYPSRTPVNVPLTRVSSQEYWTLDRTAGTSSVMITLFWEDGTFSGINTFSNDLHVGHYTSGNVWVDEGSGTMTGSTTAGSIQSAAAVSSFSPFTFASIYPFSTINPLPVELVSFNATLVNTRVDLFWTTASEKNNDFFTVEKSSDGKIFTKVLTVSGAGNSTAPINYAEVDPLPFVGTSYYRLKQTDFNGVSVNSAIVSVKNDLGLNPTISLMPNPREEGTISYLSLNQLKGQEIVIVVRDIMGREISSQKIISNSENESIAIDQACTFKKGTYLVTATTCGNQFYCGKLVVVE